MVGMFVIKVRAASDERQSGASLIHLPHVQLFVFLDAFVDLGRSEAFVGASLHDGRHFDHLVLTGQITDQGVDLVL